jgi:hypothetical protein
MLFLLCLMRFACPAHPVLLDFIIPLIRDRVQVMEMLASPSQVHMQSPVLEHTQAMKKEEMIQVQLSNRSKTSFLTQTE